jgi:hypothetical protein
MKKLASSRLQLDIERERQRERELLDEKTRDLNGAGDVNREFMSSLSSAMEQSTDAKSIPNDYCQDPVTNGRHGNRSINGTERHDVQDGFARGTATSNIGITADAERKLSLIPVRASIIQKEINELRAREEELSVRWLYTDSSLDFRRLDIVLRTLKYRDSICRSTNR